MTGAEFLAALNNIRKEYNVKDYGVVGNGSTDDTEAIQTLINTICSVGENARILFPVGIYVIAGAIQGTVDTITYNSQLYIPAKNFNDTGRISIEFVGETVPNFVQSSGVGSAISPIVGTIIRSTLVNDVDGASIICSRGPDANYSNFNYNHVSMRNISFQYTPDGDGACTISGLDFRKSANFNAENITIFPFNQNLVNSATPINGAVGIRMPAVNCDNMNVLKQCTVGGFYDGYEISDHSVLRDCQAWVCYNGISLMYNRLISMVDKFEANWCKWAARVPGPSTTYFDIRDLSIEYTIDPPGKWYDYSGALIDSGNLGKGRFEYTFHPRDLDQDDIDFFNKTGGNNVQCVPIIFHTATGFTITGARDDGTALADLITKLCTKFGFIDGTTAT